MTKERPILFSAPMVRALLDGSKTQTRRVVKVENTMGHDSVSGPRIKRYSRVYLLDRESDLKDIAEACPYGQPGDRLWVKETHWRDDEDGAILYAADRNDFEVVHQKKSDTGSPRYNWKPSIFMRREYSRITLEIVSVRIERLNDISEADANAEGVRHSLHLPGGRFARENYEHLWWTINGDGSWEANPWVWVVEFKVVKP